MNIEQKLLQAIKSNDLEKVENVFEDIYFEYGKLVGFIISKYISKKEDVEELINDVFLNFSKVLFDIKIDNIKYYLVKQAKNTAINFLKKKQNKINLVYDEEYIASLVDKNNTIYLELITDLEIYLTENEINIILLHAVYNYSFVDIAKKQSKPVTTIKSIYHRAIKKYQKRSVKND